MTIKVNRVDTKPHGYTTVGWWGFTGPANTGTLVIEIAELPDRRFYWAVLGHELIEAAWCWVCGITTQECDRWDTWFEGEYEAGRISKAVEAGDDRRCPYYVGHQFGIVWEYLCIYGTFASWTGYGNACNRLMGIEAEKSA